MATIMPSERTSPMQLKRACICFSRVTSFAPSCSERWLSFSFSMTSSTASPAAQASGEPANVPPNPPTTGASMISALPITADSGTPPAMLLATVMRSGSTPACSIAKFFPVRAKPVWISSAMSRMPCLSHRARRLRRNSGGAM